MFMGDSTSGKSSLIQSFIGDASGTVDSPTDGVKVTVFKPFKDTTINGEFMGFKKIWAIPNRVGRSL